MSPATGRGALLAKVVVNDGCWGWQGAMSGGYGRHGQSLAHRAVYEALVGPIPAGMALDHLVCDNKGCVRPSHLDPVPNAENVRRHFRKQTHCKHGHEYTEDNTYLRKNGRRSCRTCTRVAQTAAYHHNRKR